MAIVNTTLSAAMTATQTTLTVASTTNITNPNFQTAAGITYLLIDQEYMQVTAVNTTTLTVTVARGQWGTAEAAHVNGALVQSGIPTDFNQLSDAFAQNVNINKEVAFSQNLTGQNLSGSADALTGASAGFWVVQTAGVDAITLATPLAVHEGNVISIFSNSANAHTVTCPTTNFMVGASANKTVATFPARPGAGIMLRVTGGNYMLLSTSGTGTNSGPVVWT